MMKKFGKKRVCACVCVCVCVCVRAHARVCACVSFHGSSTNERLTVETVRHLHGACQVGVTVILENEPQDIMATFLTPPPLWEFLNLLL